MKNFAIIGLLCILQRCRGIPNDEYLNFPPGFSIGVASSAYQFEGGWNASGKSESVWDWFAHEKKSLIIDGSNADVTCDSYHKYKEDVDLMKDMGIKHYRFSLSWTRILPKGFSHKVNQAGLEYYHNLIDYLLWKGIEPFVTIYHWDHPEFMNRMGSWTNELMVEFFADYARFVFREFGNKIKVWVTINEPRMYCKLTHAGKHYAPGLNLPLFGEYLCVHNMLKAHARAYQIYNEEFRAKQGGKVGIVPVCKHYFPASESVSEAAKIAFDFNCGWVMNPILSRNGDYPAVMKERIEQNSRLQGLSFSRLPKLSPEWIALIQGSYDFLGLNLYSSFMVEPVPWNEKDGWFEDSGVRFYNHESWRKSRVDWLRIVPEGFGDLLRLLKDKYNNPLIYVLENGVPSAPGFYDYERIDFLYNYMKEMLLAINRDGCNVKAYTVWSLLDSFEWSRGYNDHFGLIEVDFNHPNRTRTPRLSSKWLREIIQNQKLMKLEDTQLASQLPEFHGFSRK